MTDKEQIIIDGVDVSECEFYNPYYCGMYIDGYGDSEGVCSDYEDCYYKQLARKTQECEELKEKIEQAKDFNDKVLYGKDELYKNWREQLDKTNQLKKENEELKEYKAVVDELAGKQIILTNKDKMPKLYENAKDLKLNRYRKALEEIERIATTFRARESSYHNVLDIISKAKENKQWD